jgi:hypothetical protein
MIFCYNNLMVSKQTLTLLKYAMWVLTGLILILAISSWYQNQSTEQLAGRALNAQERGETPRQFFEAKRIAQPHTPVAHLVEQAIAAGGLRTFGPGSRPKQILSAKQIDDILADLDHSL